MELKCFRAFLNKSLIFSIFILIFSATTLIAEILTDIVSDQLSQPIIKSKSLYIRYTKFPKNIYTQQRFSVDLEARILVPRESYDYILTTYEDEINIHILDKYVMWKENENNLFTTQINYKVTANNFALPKIKLSLMKDGVEIKYIKITPPNINYNEIAIKQKQFSNIIANKLQIKSVKTKQYNNKMLMVVFNIEATNANLEEFHLTKFEDQGINDFSEIVNTQSMYYYVIVPNHISSIQFDYYNPKVDNFIRVELPIILEDDLISTQTDLNPQESNLLYYKQIASIVLLTLFILFYLKTKSRIILIFMVLFTIIFISLIMPNKIIEIKANTKVYILPTKSSTVYKILNTTTKAEKLLENKEFIKVLFKNKHIGWVKENDIK